MNKEALRALPQKLVKPIAPAAVGIMAVIGGFVDGGMNKSAAEKATNNSIPAIASTNLNSETVDAPGRPLQAVLAGLSLIVFSIGWDNLRNRKENRNNLEPTNT